VAAGRGGRRSALDLEVDRAVVVANRCEQHEAVTGLDQLAHVGVEEVGARGELTPKRRLWVGDQRRKVELTAVAHQERLFVGEQTRAQRNREQREQDPQRHVAAAIALETRDATLCQR
jgi:hypothetical protein